MAASCKSTAGFSCRIVAIDYALVPPLKDYDPQFSLFSAKAIERVPIVRVFGATPVGQKTCLHLHGSFPYLLVPAPALQPPSERWLQQLARSIDRALQVSLGSGSRDVGHVLKVTPVKGL